MSSWRVSLVSLICRSDAKRNQLPRRVARLGQECLKAGEEVEVNFIGTGTRWPGEMSKVGHPLNALYNSVREMVKAGSCGCAAAFGATESLKACGIPEAKDNAVAGTPGVLSIRKYLKEGWNTLVF